jgi:hypothetical protein
MKIAGLFSGEYLTLYATTRESMHHQIDHLECQSVHSAKMMQTMTCTAVLDGCGGCKGRGYDASSMDASRPSWSTQGLAFLGPLPCSGACAWEASCDATIVLANKRRLLPDKKILHAFSMRVNQVQLRSLLQGEKADCSLFVAELQRAPPMMAVRKVTDTVCHRWPSA